MVEGAVPQITGEGLEAPEPGYQMTSVATALAEAERDRALSPGNRNAAAVDEWSARSEIWPVVSLEALGEPVQQEGSG